MAIVLADSQLSTGNPAVSAAGPGDLLICAWTGSTNVGTPSLYTIIQSVCTVYGGGPDYMSLSYKFAAGGETGVVTGANISILARFTGVKNAAPNTSNLTNTVSSRHPGTSITPTAGLNHLQVGCCGIFTGGGQPFTPDAGYTDIAQGGPVNTSYLGLIYRLVASASGAYFVGETYSGVDRFEGGIAAAFEAAPPPAGFSQGVLI